MTINGEVACQNRLVIEGRLHGSFVGGQLLIAKTGLLEGKVEAEKIECFGCIKGRVSTQSLDLKSTGSHAGTVETSELKVELGAVLDCVLQSGTMVSAEPASSDKRPQLVEKSKLEEVVGAFSEERRACCFDIPWSERLDLYNHLIDLLDKDKALVKIIGDPGSGKTVLAEKLRLDMEPQYRVIQLASQIGSVTSLLGDVAEKLGIAGIEELTKHSELLSAITGFLADGRKKGEKVLLIIDDSQDMYPASMEGITQLLTGNFGEEPDYLQMILIGTKETETIMVETIFNYFEDETNCQFNLDPLSIKDTADYLRFCIQTMQLNDTSCSISLLPYETIKAIHVASGGSVSEINKRADKALRSAIRAGATALNVQFVD